VTHSPSIITRKPRALIYGLGGAAFQIRCYLLPILLLVSVAIWPATTLAQQPVTKTCSAHAPVGNLRPTFQNLKSINLYIDFPLGLPEALACAGHEKECAEREANRAGGAVPNKDRDQFIQVEADRMRSINGGYPHDLYPDKLTERFREMVKRQFASVLPLDSSCKVPDPTLINPYASDTGYAATMGSPDVLNLTIRVKVVTTTTPHVIVLSAGTFRQGDKIDFLEPYLTAIPLNMPEDQITKAVGEFELYSHFGPEVYPEE
jgi:hypothetical protein